MHTFAAKKSTEKNTGRIDMARGKKSYRRGNKKVSIGSLIAIGGPLAIAAERWKTRGWEFALLSLTGVRIGRAAEGVGAQFDYKQALPTWSCMAVGLGMRYVGAKYVNKMIRDVPFIKL